MTHTIAAEFYSLVKKALTEGKLFPITDVSTTYKAILEFIWITNIPTRRQLKEQIADNISDVQFSQPQKNKPELLCSKTTNDMAEKSWRSKILRDLMLPM